METRSINEKKYNPLMPTREPAADIIQGAADTSSIPDHQHTDLSAQSKEEMRSDNAQQLKDDISDQPVEHQKDEAPTNPAIRGI